MDWRFEEQHPLLWDLAERSTVYVGSSVGDHIPPLWWSSDIGYHDAGCVTFRKGFFDVSRKASGAPEAARPSRRPIRAFVIRHIGIERELK